MSWSARRTATQLGERLLAGVGDGAAARIDRSKRVIHVRRALTSAEVLLLPPGWDKLEAIDRAGTAGFLDSLAKGQLG